MSGPARLLIRAIRGYQRSLSPLKGAPTCRFTPSCSEYAAQALELHGAVKGSLLAAGRILRCNPLSPGGFDPVPRPVAAADPSAAHPQPSPVSKKRES
ncbi:membrane protein insertion efficiency factor YidD [Deinococcus sp.]|uniref:membrane protein insertion efficiency factor YidD n=1 Tax=Deinococcus sp. TaxID=47478 RepID=UPI003CC5206E